MMEMDPSPRFASQLRKLNRAYALEGKYFSVNKVGNRGISTGKLAIEYRDVKYKNFRVSELPNGSRIGCGIFSCDEEIREQLDKLLKEAPNVYFSLLVLVLKSSWALAGTIIAGLIGAELGEVINLTDLF